MRVSNCKHETSNGRCGLKGCYAYRHKCFTEDLCKCHEPMTNADHIQEMASTDRGIIKELLPCILELCEDGVPSPEYMEWWLQQPCGGADHE